MDLTKKLSFSSTFLKVYLVLGKKIRKISTKLFKIYHWNDRETKW